MRTDALDYALPPERIATAPAEPRDAARLMLCRRDTGAVTDHQVRDLPDLDVLGPGDLMLVNQTRVLPAALEGVRVRTGGRVGGLYLGAEGDDDRAWRVLLESRGTLTPGEAIRLDDDASLDLLEPRGSGEWLARLTDQHDATTLDVLQRVGQTPLPPYIRRQRKARGESEQAATDPDRYNTVFAAAPGSVAAPTAGLHFTPDLLARLERIGVHRAAVTLHVGPGTFAPVRTDTLEDHAMHAELIDVPQTTIDAIAATRARAGRILCVGTTTVRAVESLPEPPAPFAGPTDLFITPDRVAAGAFRFRYTDHLMTNFHLPRSTLLALVAALPDVGLDQLLNWYNHAINHRYRFYSYGDAMLVL